MKEIIERSEFIADVTPAWQILDELPEECRRCISILPKVDELAFWVDQRITPVAAARLILERAGCHRAVLEQTVGLAELA